MVDAENKEVFVRGLRYAVFRVHTDLEESVGLYCLDRGIKLIYIEYYPFLLLEQLWAVMTLSEIRKRRQSQRESSGHQVFGPENGMAKVLVKENGNPGMNE